MERENHIRERFEDLVKRLIRGKLTVATMESATGGQLASLFTDTEGSSAIFAGGLVTYSNESKIRFGVDAGVIEQYSVYSPETAQAMAEACRQFYGADIGIGITGNFANIDPNNPEDSKPGEVFVGIDWKGSSRGLRICLSQKIPLRYQAKLEVANGVADTLKEWLQEEK